MSQHGAIIATDSSPRPTRVKHSRVDDPVGCYFDRFAAATGESIEVTLISRTATGAEEQYRFDHSVHDAHGALWQHAYDHGYAIELPQPRPRSAPSVPAQLMAMTRGFVVSARARRPTLAVDYRRAEAAPATTRWFPLTAAQTVMVQATARAQQVSVTAVLVWSLHRALGLEVGAPDHTCGWSLPVSLRGSLPDAPPFSNQAAPVMVTLDGSTSLAAVSHALRSQLDAHMHWGTWRQLALLARLPSRLYQALIRRDEAATRARGDWFAIFSNIGACHGDPRVVARAMLALTSPTTPLAATALTWNGRLSLAVEVRAGLGSPEVHATPLLATWLEQLGRACNFDGEPVPS